MSGAVTGGGRLLSLVDDRTFEVPGVPLPRNPSAGDVARVVDSARGQGSALLREVEDQRDMAAVSEWFASMRTAAGERLADLVRCGRKLAVFGDYDADGICSTAAMGSALAWLRLGSAYGSFLDVKWAMAEAGVLVRVPERVHGYGLSPFALQDLHADGFRDVVCVDNGTSALGALMWAEVNGMSVLVVDHHPTDGDGLAFWAVGREGLRVANPMLPGPWRDALSLESCGSSVCAAMMVHAVACEAASRLGLDHRDLPWTAALAGFASVTDMMPVVGANRLAVKSLILSLGGDAVPPAVSAMAADALVRAKVETEFEVAMAARVDSPDLFDHPLDSSFVGYDAGPRVNACGRMGRAGLALDFMLASEPDAVSVLAEVGGLNASRQEAERAAVDMARGLVAEAVDGLPAGYATARATDYAMFSGAELAALLERSCVSAQDPASRACAVVIPGLLCVSATEGADGGIVGLVASRLSKALGLPTVSLNLAPKGPEGLCPASGSGRVPEGHALIDLGIDTGIVLAGVAKRSGGSGGGHAAAFGLKFQLGSDDRAANLARIRRFAVECAVALVREMAAVPGLLEVAMAPPPSIPVDLVSPELGGVASLARSVIDCGPYGHGMRAPLVGIRLPASGVVALGKSGSFEVRPLDGSRPIKMMGFANRFDGGLASDRAPVLKSALKAGGVVAVGTLANSFYGRSDQARWRGPRAEFVMDALATEEQP